MCSEEVEIASTGDAFKNLDCKKKQQYTPEGEEDRSEHEKGISSKECLMMEFSQHVYSWQERANTYSKVQDREGWQLEQCRWIDRRTLNLNVRWSNSLRLEKTLTKIRDNEQRMGKNRNKEAKQMHAIASTLSQISCT